MKGYRYSFEIKSDTFNYLTDNAEEFNYGHGLFWQLYQDSSERIVRHYLFEPDTKKRLRIYLVVAHYKNNKDLEKMISEFEIAMNKPMTCPGCKDIQKMRLSPIHDYIITGDKKLFWMNAGYPYSNQEILMFVDVLKNNVDTTRFKGKIICLFGSDCRTENVP